MKTIKKIFGIAALAAALYSAHPAEAQEQNVFGTLYNEGAEVIGTYKNEDEYLKLQLKHLNSTDKNAESLLATEKLCLDNQDKSKDGLVYLIFTVKPNERKSYENLLTHIEAYDLVMHDNTQLYGSFEEAVSSEECKTTIENDGRSNVFIIEINLKRLDDNGKPILDDDMNSAYDMQKIYTLDGKEAADTKGASFKGAKGLW